jgi:acyl-CoA thioester hydrolase
MNIPATPLVAEIEILPAFHEIDMMEVVWHGHYVKYLEKARDTLLSRLGYDYPAMRLSGYAWPVVDMRLKYVAPARFGQALRVRAEIVEWENRLRIAYLIHDISSGCRLHEASTIQLAVDMATGQTCFVCPPVLWQRLGVSP